MAINVNWDNADNTIIRYEFAGNWTDREFDNAVELSFALTESVKHEVHVIMDMRRTKNMPNNGMLLLKRKFAVLPYNRGMIYVVGCNPSTLAAFRMIIRMNHRLARRIVMVNNLVDARSQLRDTNMMSVLQPETPVFAL